MPASVNCRGKQFGRLIAIEYKGKYIRKDGQTGGNKWLCLCTCGNKVEVIYGNLSSGNTRSCGCLLKDINKERGGQFQ